MILGGDNGDLYFEAITLEDVLEIVRILKKPSRDCILFKLMVYQDTPNKNWQGIWKPQVVPKIFVGTRPVPGAEASLAKSTSPKQANPMSITYIFKFLLR